MKLKEHYNKLYNDSINKISSNNFVLDTLIDSKNDNRLGLTLLVRPTDIIKSNISRFIEKVQEIDPAQYYYPQSDMHITVLSIISAFDGFDISNIQVYEYIEILDSIISKYRKFNIQFKGITASPSCIIIQGFPEKDILNNIRNDIRKSFKDSNLFNSIDSRYELITAHSTVIRFKNKLINIDKYLNLLDEYREYDFGSFEVSALELVHNDWYHKKQNTKLIKKFILN